MRALRAFLVTALLLLCSSWATADPPASYPDISHSDLKAAIKSHGVFLIDCNGTSSYQNGHIPTAIDFETQQGRLAQLLPSNKNALIVAYCRDPR